MRKHLSLSLLTAGLIALPATRASAQGAAEARKSYDAQIQDAKRKFLTCDAEALAAGETEDYTGLDATGHVTKGRAADLKGLREFCAANTVTAWDATTTDFHSSGPLAWAAGTIRMAYKAKATGKAGRTDGRYLATYERQPDGRWFQQYFVMVPLREK